MKYKLAKNIIVRKEKFDRIRFFIYSSRTHKMCEISLLANKILKTFENPLDISDALSKISPTTTTKSKILKFLDKMIDDKYLEKYEQRT